MLLRAGLPLLAFALINLVYIALFNYRAPYFDHWDLVPMFEASEAGGLNFIDLFALHGGHWHAGAYALLLPLAELTRWSHLAEAALSLAFMAGAGALYLRLAHRFAGGAPFSAYASAVAFIALSLDQASNLLWGFQLSVFMSQFGVALAFVALTEERLGALPVALALVGFALAVTSYATGFALAPIGLALIALRQGTRVLGRAAAGAVWTLACAAAVFLFLRAHSTGADGTLETEALSGASFLAFALEFEVNFIGAAMSRFAEALMAPVAIAGVVGAAAMAAFLARRGVSMVRLSIPLSLCGFALLAGLLCAAGRLEFGADQGANSRYITFANAFWIGFALLALASLSAIRGKIARRALFAAVALLALLKLGNSIQAGVKHAELSHEIALAAREMRVQPERAEEIAQPIAAPWQNVGPRAAYIRDKGWSAFR